MKITPKTCPYVDQQCGTHSQCVKCLNEAVHEERLIDLTDVKEFLDEAFPKGVQMFDTHNTKGEGLIEIYSTGGISVLFAPFYGYIEIFGITHEQFKELDAYCNGHSSLL